MLIPYTLNLGGRLFSLATPQVMGIVNLTPDSFYPASRVQGEKALTERIGQILREGGSIVDIGACSTRPGGGFRSAECILSTICASSYSILDNALYLQIT